MNTTAIVQFFRANVSRKLWFRAALYSLFSVLAALAAWYLAPLIPQSWPTIVGANSIGEILGILGASMLSVTVFSLTAMVSAYASASSNVTPRAAALLLSDPTSQHALSTFLGAFLFSLVAIIALGAGIYGSSGRIVVFGATLVMIVVVAGTLVRWIGHLSTFGLTGDVIRRVETAAAGAMRKRAENPFLGGEPACVIPAFARPIYADETGYVSFVDMQALARLARQHGRIHVEALPGARVHPTRALAWVEASAAAVDECEAGIRKAFQIGRARTFDQDPRFGLIVLGEIASRALSPGINDPGTAYAVLDAQLRVIDIWNEAKAKQTERPEVACPDVHVPPLEANDLLDDAFRGIARDGAGMQDVAERLQRTLALLARRGDAPMRVSASALSRYALAHAERALAIDADRDRVRLSARGVPAA